MKLIICGKGGSGKSTITSLLSRQYAREGKRVIVVDTDVSNVGLHRIMGLESPPDLIGYFGGKEKMGEFMRESRRGGTPQDVPALGTWTYDTIPKEYRSELDGVQLVSVGKINEATEGCKCSISALARQFILGLTPKKDERVIIDTEAGIEHFGRGFDSLCNAIIMVVDSSYESQCLVRKISDMADTVAVPLYFILNKTDEATSATLRDVIPDKSRIIGEFGLDPALIEAGLMGQALPGSYPEAAEVVQRLAERGGESSPA
ncbi:MAG: P-loop NTPase [Methanomicrobiales archaeon]|nr:P-loop NTPase [Methanomicrobiales archaeon]